MIISHQYIKHAFDGVNKVETITLPALVNSIETKAFVMSSLRLVVARGTTAITCNENVFVTTSPNLRIYISNGLTTTLCKVTANKTITSYNSIGTYVDYITTNAGELIIYGKDGMNDFETKENQPWKSQIENIKTIEIDDDVTTIGKNAFNSFTNLKSITIANSVTSIGDYAFQSSTIELYFEYFKSYVEYATFRRVVLEISA